MVVAATLSDLASVFIDLGDPSRARELLERALPIEEAKYDHSPATHAIARYFLKKGEIL